MAKVSGLRLSRLAYSCILKWQSVTVDGGVRKKPYEAWSRALVPRSCV